MGEITGEEEKAIRRQTIDRLRMHFVYNTLNGIRYYIRTDENIAYAMIGELATFFRGSVENALEQKVVPVLQELKYARAYAELEKHQRDVLNVIWKVTIEDGYVAGGSIYEVIVRFVKKYVANRVDKCTLVVEDGADGETVRISIPEVEAMEEIMILSGGCVDENDIG